MKIAITSQTIKSVTAHAGRCRKFWVYELSNICDEIDKEFVELDLDETLHTMSNGLPKKLEGISVLITANLGDSLKAKLSKAGVSAYLTSDTQPDVALLNYLANSCIKH